MGKHKGHIIIEKVLQLKRQGLTKREIGEELGYSVGQIKELLKRHRLPNANGLSYDCCVKQAL